MEVVITDILRIIRINFEKIFILIIRLTFDTKQITNYD